MLCDSLFNLFHSFLDADLVLLALEASWVICRQFPRELQGVTGWHALIMLLKCPHAQNLEFKHETAAKVGKVLVELPMNLMDALQSTAHKTSHKDDKCTLALLACSFVDVLNILLEQPEVMEPVEGSCYVDTSGAIWDTGH